MKKHKISTHPVDHLLGVGATEADPGSRLYDRGGRESHHHHRQTTPQTLPRESPVVSFKINQNFTFPLFNIL